MGPRTAATTAGELPDDSPAAAAGHSGQTKDAQLSVTRLPVAKGAQDFELVGAH